MRTCEEHGSNDKPIVVPCWVNETVTNTAILTASNIHIVTANPLQFDETVKTELTSQLIVLSQANQNCSKTLSLPAPTTLSTTFTQTASIAIS